MNPVLRHIQESYLDFPLSEVDLSRQWTFTQRLQQVGPDFYSKIVPHHLLLNFEYSVLCCQLKSQLAFPDQENEEQLKDQLIAALMLAELMEQMYLKYLDVPREVRRLRQHKKLYRELLKDWKGYTFSFDPHDIEEVDVGYSLAQVVRNTTVQSNMYRQFIVRTKRLLDVIALLATGSEAYQKFISGLGMVANPILPHLAWFFFLPRLLSNLALVLKHTIPGNWMSDEEKSLPWQIRLEAQMQRRWFELGNDSIWVMIGLVNCFILVGALAPIGAYINAAFFGYDVILSSVRAYVELNRLYNLREEYKVLLAQEDDPDSLANLEEFLIHLDERIYFEQQRLGANVTAMAFLFIAMMFTIPALAFNPVFPLIGAIILVATTIANNVATQIIENDRPQDDIEPPPSAARLGFFSKNKPPINPINEHQLMITL